MAIQWNMSGNYFETCSCDNPCPCAFLSPPTKGYCSMLAGWHIEKGQYGDVVLDGLNVALAAHSPGHMMEVKWKAALYIDERADDAQRDALTQIFSGKVGGQPAKLAAHIEDFLGVKAVPIEYRVDGKHRSLRIPNIAEAEIVDLAAEGVESITISERPWSNAPGHATTVAKSERLEFDDYGLQWRISGENGYHSDFRY